MWPIPAIPLLPQQLWMNTSEFFLGKTTLFCSIFVMSTDMLLKCQKEKKGENGYVVEILIDKITGMHC